MISFTDFSKFHLITILAPPLVIPVILIIFTPSHIENYMPLLIFKIYYLMNSVVTFSFTLSIISYMKKARIIILHKLKHVYRTYHLETFVLPSLSVRQLKMVIDGIILIGLDLDIPELKLFFPTVSESQKFKYSNNFLT